MAAQSASPWSQLFAKKRPEPSYPTLPDVNEGTDETNIEGIYAVGELAGTPLVLLGLNAGHDLVTRIGPELKQTQSNDEELLDLLIVGSGSSGLAATVAAKDLGLKYQTVEAAAFANTFVTMTKNKWLFAEPFGVDKRSRVWFEECTKEKLLEEWNKIRTEENLNISVSEKVVNITGQKDNFVIKTSAGEYRARRVALCMGKSGNPRKLGVPGEKENADRIHHKLLDPDDFEGQHLLIVGAGDVACEAAIALASVDENTVTMSAIDQEFTYPKKRNIDRVRALEADGKLTILLSSAVKEFTDEVAIIEQEGKTLEVKYDNAFEMIGAELPIPFFNKVGIRLANTWHLKKWIALVGMFLFVYSLYALKSYGKAWVQFPFNLWITPEQYDGGLLAMFKIGFAPFSWMFSPEALADIHGDRGFQQGYLYSGLYTVLMGIFGYEAMIRWRGKAKNKEYQTYRFISLISFQVGFFLIVNIIGVKALSAAHAWRFWGLYQPFPLFFNTFFWWYPSDELPVVAFFVGAGLLGSLVFIPFMARNHGKRFCTWICGCGGLAETLGDRWRHLAPKGPRSRSWEFQGVAIFLASLLVLVIVTGASIDSTADVVAWKGTPPPDDSPWWKTYSYLVDFWLVAVIPIALYPFFGGKVWCRYWCPLAAYNGLLSKWYGRLKIIANKDCIQCTECSKYCQVGVDVMAFAKNEQPFDNSNTACIHCGICIDVCPMNVLSFETSNGSAVELIKLGKSTGLPVAPAAKKPAEAALAE